MKKYLIGAAAAPLCALGLTAVVAVPASAASPSCVEKKEFRQVERGMSKARVANIFDIGGRQTSVYSISGTRYESRSYRSCTRYGSVYIDFEDGRVSSRMAFW